MKDCERELALTDVLHLPEGVVVVRTPVFLSPESAESLGDFLELVLRQARRSAPPVARLAIAEGGDG